MSRPVIGLTCYEEAARWGIWDLPAVLLPSMYARAVWAAGGAPVLLPPITQDDPDGEGVAAVLERLDGLVAAGGPDVDPGRYGALPGPHTGEARPERDESELRLIGAFADAGRPVLGVCRGLQLLNVARGGTLHQHLPDVVGHHDHSPQAGSFPPHPVEVLAGTALAGIVGAGLHQVPTHHHQAVDRAGKGLEVSARSADGTVEALEDPDAEFVLGIQWHPEAGEDPALFRALVAAARRG